MNDNQPIDEKGDEKSSSSSSAQEPTLANSPDAEADDDNETRKDDDMTDNKEEHDNGTLPSPAPDTTHPKTCDHPSYSQTFASSGDLFVESEMAYSLSELDPPASRLERLRDWWLQFLGGKVHFWIGVVVMVLIIADGAFFFFLLVGAHGLCRPRTDCEPRNYWYNWSIQFLNVLFSYLATITLPWRISNAVHLFGKRRPSKPGLDLYGQPTEEIWYHCRQVKRKVVVVFLLLNSATQWANQASRIVFYSYELQDSFPGSLWTNIFFVSSMLCAGIAGFVQLHEEMKIRREHQDRFPPGLFDVVKHYLKVVCCQKRKDCDVEECQGDVEDQRPLPEREESERKRCLHGLRKLIRNDKTSLDLWGL